LEELVSDRPKRGEPIRKITRKNGSIGYRLRAEAGRDANGKRLQVCSTWDTLAEARTEHARIRLEARAGTFVAKTDVTVEEWVHEWLDGRHSLKPGTVSNYRHALRPVIDAFGSVRIQDLRFEHVERLVAMRLKVVSPRTVQLTLKVLSQALDAAIARGVLQRNVVALVDKPKKTTPEIGRAWAPSEAQAFLELGTANRYQHGWHLSLLGLRRSEVVGLRWDDVDLVEGHCYVRQARVVVDGSVIVTTPKSGKGRRVPLSPGAIQALTRAHATQTGHRLQLGARYQPSGYVVVDGAGRPIRPETYAREFRNLIKAFGLPKIRLQDLRHTTASILASNGTPLLVAADILGHDPVVFAKTYAHLYDGDRRTAVDGLGSRLSPQQGDRSMRL